MRLVALFSSGEDSPLPPSQKRGLLYVHVLFLGTVVLLHRQYLASIATAHRQGAADGSVSAAGSQPIDVMKHGDRPVTAARQIARIFRLVDYERNVFRRCWLCMLAISQTASTRPLTLTYSSEIYSSSTVLLFLASYKLANDDVAGSLEELSFARSMIQMLSHASLVDHVAKRLHGVLYPLYSRIDELRGVAANRTPGYERAAELEQMCRAALEQTIGYLENVFGDERRLDVMSLSTVESYHLPTWWT